MKGLSIREPWISKILAGDKTWEIRGTRAKPVARMGLIKSGSGLVVGTASLVDCVGPLTPGQLDETVDMHRVPAERREGVFGRYKDVYAWVLSNVEKLDPPVPYEHRRGAVTWMTVPDV